MFVVCLGTSPPRNKMRIRSKTVKGEKESAKATSSLSSALLIPFES